MGCVNLRAAAAFVVTTVQEAQLRFVCPTFPREERLTTFVRERKSARLLLFASGRTQDSVGWLRLEVERANAFLTNGIAFHVQSAAEFPGFPPVQNRQERAFIN